MYLFYEQMKNEIDLQDLVQYLYEPLQRLNLLHLKLQEYQKQQQKQKHIEVEQLITEYKKITENILPELMSNYTKLSLEFRNKVSIKEIKDSEGNIVKLTSKDLLLKNVGKIIEHIQIMEEKFYKHFSFDFLVNTRIISELGFQDNFIDDKSSPIILQNKYVFSKKDASEIINHELIKNNDKNKIIIKKEENPTTKLKLKPIESDNQINIEKILDKKNIDEPNVVVKEDNGTSMIFMGIMIVLFASAFMTFGLNKHNSNEQYIQQQVSQYHKVDPFEPDKQVNVTKTILELAQEKEKNNIQYSESIELPYQQSFILMSNIMKWRDISNKSGLNINKDDISYNNLISNGLYLKEGQLLGSAKDLIYQGKAYHIDIINNKAQLKISNVAKNECQYLGLKLGSQYNMTSNKEKLNADNMKEVCSINNEIAMEEK